MTVPIPTHKKIAGQLIRSVIVVALVAVAALACVGPLWSERDGGFQDATYFNRASQVESARSKLGRLTEEQMQSFKVETQRIRMVAHKHADQLLSHPKAHGLSVWFLYDERGRYSDEVGILVLVTEKVDGKNAPKEQRIPARLEGIKVQMIQRSMGRYY